MAVRGAACAGGLVWGEAKGSLRSGCTQSTSKGAGWEVQEMRQLHLSPCFPAAVLISQGCGLRCQGHGAVGPWESRKGQQQSSARHCAPRSPRVCPRALSVVSLPQSYF